jgi:hypothetical protein
MRDAGRRVSCSVNRLILRLWGAHGIPFNDEPKSELFPTASIERATTLLNQSAAFF